MTNSNIQLNIGDEIGFVILAQDIDSSDKTVFFPVAEICDAQGERAYRYQYPDGELSRGIIRESELIGRLIKINVQPQQPETTMICLSDRKDEFLSALSRAKNSSLTVYNDFEFDNFVVVNRENNSEYRVKLETKDNKVHAECGCPDFKFRKRICKHISSVLTDTVFGILAKG